MLDLLQNVGFTIGYMYIHKLAVIIHQRRIAVKLKLLPCLYQGPHRTILGLCANIVVASVIPAAHIQTRDMLAGLILGICSRSLCVQVKMFMIDRRLQGIIKVGRTVPDAIRLVDQNMVHLHREIMVQSRMPGLIQNIFGNRKCCCSGWPIAKLIKAW